MKKGGCTLFSSIVNIVQPKGKDQAKFLVFFYENFFISECAIYYKSSSFLILKAISSDTFALSQNLLKKFIP